jgi:septal ring factor EnvC (AmiA/AmiB activator)
VLPAAGLLAQDSSGPPAAPSSDEHRRDLAAIRREIGLLEERLAHARDKERTLQERLEAAALELQLQRRRVAEAVAARGLAEERVAEAELEVARLEEALHEARTSLRKRVTGLYRLGRHGHLRLLLSVEAGSDLPSAVRLLRFLVRRDARAIDGFREAAERLAAERERLVAERLEVERWVEQAETRRRRLATVRTRQERLLARARDERRELAERAETLVEKERKLTNLIDFLSGRQIAPLSGRPIGEFRGVLDWPVAGEVVLGFGPRTDPRYRTEVPHNGIEIRPEVPAGRSAGPGGRPARAEIRAVYPGKVLFAAPFEGYGLTVIVHHPGRVFSLYAGLDELLVAQGDVLELGDPVGMTAGRVYFEVRRENRPEDPLSWLR